MNTDHLSAIRFNHEEFSRLLQVHDRSYGWVARKTGYSRQHIRSLAIGTVTDPGGKLVSLLATLFNISESALYTAADDDPTPAEAAHV